MSYNSSSILILPNDVFLNIILHYLDYVSYNLCRLTCKRLYKIFKLTTAQINAKYKERNPVLIASREYPKLVRWLITWVNNGKYYNPEVGRNLSFHGMKSVIEILNNINSPYISKYHQYGNDNSMISNSIRGGHLDLCIYNF